jgi:hypothetical protein
VEIISSGYTYARLASVSLRIDPAPYSGVGVDGAAVDIKVVLRKHLGTLVDGSARSVKDTAQHVLRYTKLQAVAGEFYFRLSPSDALAFVGGDVCTFLTSIPEVPSKTWSD